MADGGGNVCTPNEQYAINRCYVYLKLAMNEIEQVRHRDTILVNVQNSFYRLADTLQQYVKSTEKGEE